MKNTATAEKKLNSPQELRNSIASATEFVKAKSGDSSRDVIGEAEFRTVAEMVGKLTGIVIKSHKREMIQSRLSRRLRALGKSSFKEYLDFVASDAGKGEIGELINAVTTNLTAFFREGHHFEHLREHILEPMASANVNGRLRIWSSASSSGEEPYSIAMTVLSSSAAKMRDLRILATDLDTNMLDKCRRGVYAGDRAQAIPPQYAANAFDKRANGEIEFRAAAKNLLTFNQLNLLHDWPMKGPFDAIFCRNVLIYFDNDTKKKIVDRMASLLRTDGALYLGHSESLLGEHPKLTSEGRTIYRRKP